MIAEIRLNKRTKTIKVVNRRNNLRLQHTGKAGPQGPQGDVGPQGPQGPTGVSTFVRVHHGSDPNVARPDALYVEWVGSVAPNNATTEDTWIDTA
jgi:hypothetical protein